jgi:hypothetical protein
MLQYLAGTRRRVKDKNRVKHGFVASSRKPMPNNMFNKF